MNRFQWTRFLFNMVQWTRFLMNTVQWTRFSMNRDVFICGMSTRTNHSVCCTRILCIYSVIIFLLTLDTSVSTYLLDQNVLSHPRHLHFYVSTWPFLRMTWYLRIYSTISPYLLDRFYVWHDIYVSTRPFLRIYSTVSTYLLHRFYVWHIYSTELFFRIHDTSISTYLLDHN